MLVRLLGGICKGVDKFRVDLHVEGDANTRERFWGGTDKGEWLGEVGWVTGSALAPVVCNRGRGSIFIL